MLLHRSCFTSCTSSTGDQLLHISYQISAKPFAQEFFHRSCYTDAVTQDIVTQEQLRRSSYTGVATLESPSRWSTCIAHQNSYISRSSISLFRWQWQPGLIHRNVTAEIARVRCANVWCNASFFCPWAAVCGDATISREIKLIT